MVHALLLLIAILTLGVIILAILQSLIAIVIKLFRPSLSTKEVWEKSLDYASTIFFGTLWWTLIIVLTVLFLGFCVVIGMFITGIYDHHPSFMKMSIISIIVGLILIGLVCWPLQGSVLYSDVDHSNLLKQFQDQSERNQSQFFEREEK